MSPQRFLTLCVAWWMMCALLAAGTPTENHGIRALPAPGPVEIDGQTGDWDLSGGMFICGDCEKNRQHFSYWAHLMYDKENLYLLARVRDRHPMNNTGIVGSDMGFREDCWQFRFITDYKGKNETVAHFTAWQGKGGVDVIDIAYGRKFNEGGVKDAQDKGAAMVLRKDPDGKGYVQEIKLPLPLIAKGGLTLGPGVSAVMTFELFFAGGMSVKDNFRPGVNPDRIFTFRAYDNWGTVTFVEKNNVTPQKVRLADGREFPVTMTKGQPVVDWTGLIKDPYAYGFKPIAFEMPFDGYASIHIRDAEGTVVRQLVNFKDYYGGKQAVKWDGLTTPDFRTPGEPVPAGTYTWHGIVHPGLDLVLQGWASNGGRVPWDSGKTANWGGDHGVPSDVDGNDKILLLGWTGSEAGKAVVATDLDGRVLWRHTRGGMGGASLVAVDGETGYVVDHGSVVYRLDLTKGEPSFWKGRKSADLHLTQLWDTTLRGPGETTGLEAHDGKLYLSFGGRRRFEPEDIPDPAALLKTAMESKGLAGDFFAARYDEKQKTRLLRYFEKGEERFKPDAKSVAKHLTWFLWDRAKALPGDEPRAVKAAKIQMEMIQAFGDALGPVHRTDFIAVVDGSTGARLRTLDVPAPGRLRMGPDGKLYVVSAQNAVLRLDPETGEQETLVAGLGAATGIALDAQGQIYVTTREPDHQVKVFDKAGTMQKTLGKPGGRVIPGPWDAQAFHNLAGAHVDGAGKLWLAEGTNTPKRFAVADPATGHVTKEFFGPAHYGASGGAIHPEDPSIMIGEGCEWRLDPETGRASCLGVYDAEIPSFTRFCKGENGQVYLATNHGRSGVVHVYQRLGEGRYALRAKVDSLDNGGARFWSDANGDGKEQEDEVTSLPYKLAVSGYVGWSMGMSHDLSIWAPVSKLRPPRWDRKTESKEAYQARMKALEAERGPIPAGAHVPVGGFTACQAPVWNLKNVQPIPRTASAPLPSRDHKTLVGYSFHGDPGPNQWKGIDLATGRVRWTYPNGWHGVHGSHRAPPPQAGLVRGAFGLVGCVKGPAPLGHLWAINSNVGEWHLLSETGFYVSRLFQGDLLEVKWPQKAAPGVIVNDVPAGAGAEDFGGTLTQTADGRIFLQAGKVALWNLELQGLDRVQALPGGTITIAPADVKKAAAARAKLLQEAAGTKTLVVKPATPAFTGNLAKDFPDARELRFQKKGDSSVRVRVAYDAQHLYLGWDVRDRSPWVNGADAPPYMYARGDTVDVQLATDPGADGKRAEAVRGDLRLSIGPHKGKIVGVVYREKAKDKAPMVFSSGVVKAFSVERVTVLEDLEAKLDARGDGYTLEAKIPLDVLGLSSLSGKTLYGDFGVTHGDKAGVDTVLRTFWNNQQTGLVSDEVFELKLAPANWGKLRFQP